MPETFFIYNYVKLYTMYAGEPRFDINVTIPPYVMADMDGIFGSIMAK